MLKAVSRPHGDVESMGSAVSSSEEISDMKGQWKGKFEGTNDGGAILDMDEGQTCFKGIAFLTESNPELPSYLVEVETPKVRRNSPPK